MVTLLITLGTALLVLLGELLHVCACGASRISRSAPASGGRRRGAGAPFVRVARRGRPLRGARDPGRGQAVTHHGRIPPEQWRHLVLVYDVSPSMLIRDAGPNADMTRAARELIDSLF